jgi:hypothetical protein
MNAVGVLARADEIGSCRLAPRRRAPVARRPSATRGCSGCARSSSRSPGCSGWRVRPCARSSRPRPAARTARGSPACSPRTASRRRAPSVSGVGAPLLDRLGLFGVGAVGCADGTVGAHRAARQSSGAAGSPPLRTLLAIHGRNGSSRPARRSRR